jgi:hypothetical protein
MDNDTVSFYSPIVDSPNMKQSGQNYFTRVNPDLAKYNLLVTIRLGDIDFFNKLPLIRGGFVQLNIGFNASKQTVTYNPTTNTLTSTAPSIVGHANPIMVASAAPYQPNSWMEGLTGTSSFYISGNPVSVQDTAGGTRTNDILSASRVVMPLYTMNPEFEKSYIMNEPVRDIFYEDVYQYTISGISPNGEINQIITNGLSRPKYLVIMPSLNPASHQGFTGTAVYNSPFSSEPGTSTPCAFVTNFNVLSSGTPVFSQNFTYTYEQYIYETKAILSLNGGQNDRLASSLLSFQDYEFGYRAIVVDLSRRVPSDNISRSIQIIGTNNTLKTMDYLCFVTYEKVQRIDVRNSQLFPTVSSGGLMKTAA